MLRHEFGSSSTTDPGLLAVLLGVVFVVAVGLGVASLVRRSLRPYLVAVLVLVALGLVTLISRTGRVASPSW